MNFHSQQKEKKGMCHIVASPTSLAHTQLEGMGGRLVLLLTLGAHAQRGLQ